MWYIQKMGYYSALKRNETLTHATTWVNLKAKWNSQIHRKVEWWLSEAAGNEWKLVFHGYRVLGGEGVNILFLFVCLFWKHSEEGWWYTWNSKFDVMCILLQYKSNGALLSKLSELMTKDYHSILF